MINRNLLYNKLCSEAAKWIENLVFDGLYKYIYIQNSNHDIRLPDVWGANGCMSIMVVVKTKYSSFTNYKKFILNYENDDTVGNYRYILCPEGIINASDLPENWGLIWWNEKNGITKKVEAKYLEPCNKIELSIFCSILKRENIIPQIFDFRTKNSDPRFTTPCFIKNKSQKLHKKLEKLGYIRLHQHGEYTRVSDGYYAETKKKPSSHYIDCGDNENLFLALAALRNDSDYGQWFISSSIWQLSLLQNVTESLGFNSEIWHKATETEIIEHFNENQSNEISYYDTI